MPKSEFSKLRSGQRVVLSTGSNDSEARELEGRIIFLSSLADGDTQSRLARVEVTNADRVLIPGLFVSGRVVVREREVPVAVRAEALQRFRDWDVVFKKVGQIFEIAIVTLGEADGDLVEITEGLDPGVEYVAKNSFVIKADVMKAGATHDH